MYTKDIRKIVCWSIKLFFLPQSQKCSLRTVFQQFKRNCNWKALWYFSFWLLYLRGRETFLLPKDLFGRPDTHHIQAFLCGANFEESKKPAWPEKTSCISLSHGWVWPARQSFLPFLIWTLFSRCFSSRVPRSVSHHKVAFQEGPYHGGTFNCLFTIPGWEELRAAVSLVQKYKWRASIV